MKTHLICERDVGLFSLIQQVIAHVPWALQTGRIPIAFFEGRCCYWVPEGYRGRSTVWEYYFDALDPHHTADSIPREVRSALDERFPRPWSVGHALNETTWVSSHFGDHPQLAGRTLAIPYGWKDPDARLRERAAEVIRTHIRPRSYVNEKVESFFDEKIGGRRVVGVHLRGTDALSRGEERAHRSESLTLDAYREEVGRYLESAGDARVFVATDDRRSLEFMQSAFGDRVVAFDSLRHETGEVAGRGPTGALMPAYVARDRALAARNGEEAVIEYLLLARCDLLVHNGSSLARTALLKNPDLPHVNTHRKNKLVAHAKTLSVGKLRRAAKRSLRRAGDVACRSLPEVEVAPRYHLIQHIDGNAGFCAILTYTLNGIRMALRDGAIPVVHYGRDATRFFHDPSRGENMWEYFFEPVSDIRYEQLQIALERGEIAPDQVHSFAKKQIFDWHHSDPDRIATFWAKDVPADPSAWMAEKRELGRKYVGEHIRVKPHITEKVEDFWESWIQPQFTIGVHIRGTDFAYAEPTSPFAYFDAIDEYVALTHPDRYRIFLATDQNQFVDLFRKRYGDRIVTTNSLRSDGRRPAFKFSRESPYTRGEDVLVDLLLLSRCNFLFKGAAAVGEVALWFNPSLGCHDFALESRFDPRTIQHLVPAWRKLEIDQWSPPPWSPRRWHRALNHRLGPFVRRIRQRMPEPR